ncbi:hypothetical protein HAX54_049485 [Datura stramonium]|uniref:CRAL/TRIO N-terminal domain-containing protein n=1 Tax=Datura stramonium TaxID=4076 RepID=A0ABS8RR30_DATST|nr:hypothetical protein [Datura stramonium]
MDRNQEIALTQLRKSVEKLGSSTERFMEKTLMRFLIARSMDPEKAAKMFCQWGWKSGGLKWFHLVKVSKHFPSKDQVQFKKLEMVHILDKTIASSFKGREIGNEKLIGILDLQNITYSNVDARGLITGFQFLQFFVSVWRFICRFLEKATQEKIQVVTSEEQKEEFIREGLVKASYRRRSMEGALSLYLCRMLLWTLNCKVEE